MSTRRKILLAGVALAVLSAAALAAAWTQRRPIARKLINDYLEDRGVTARYDVVELGPKQQRLENIVVGDPANPDLSVKWAEVDVVTRLSGVEIKAVRASGVKVRGSYKSGKLSLGVLDRLIPKSTSSETRLPDIELGLEDARARLESDYGQIGVRLDGKGNLAHDFTGQIGAVAPSLNAPACTLKGATLFGTVKTSKGAPSFAGPMRFARSDCAGLAATGGDFTLDGKSDAAFNALSAHVKMGLAGLSAQQGTANGVMGALDIAYDRARDEWLGRGNAHARSASAAGASAALRSFTFDFAGITPLIKGRYVLDLDQARHPQARVAALTADGDFSWAAASPTERRFSSGGGLSLRGLVPQPGLLGGLNRLRVKAKGTPVEPLSSALVRDLGQLNRGGNAGARFHLAFGQVPLTLALSDLNFKGANGIKLAGLENSQVFYSPSIGLNLSGPFSFSGGGLPSSLVSFESTGRGIGNLRGRAMVAPYAVGDTRLATTPVNFAYGPRGLSLDTVATFDGYLSGAQVAGLKMPIGLNGGALALNGCHNLSMNGLRFAGLSLDPATFSACIQAGQVTLASPRLEGRHNGQRLRLVAQAASLPLSDGPFRLDQANLSYGNASASLRGIRGVYDAGKIRFSADGVHASQGSIGGSADQLSGNVTGTRGTFNARSVDVSYQGVSGHAANVGGTFDGPNTFFDARIVAIRAGSATRPAHFDMASLSGRTTGLKGQGDFTEGRGALGGVPLDVSGANGRWAFARNALDVTTGLTLRHDDPLPRFEPLMSSDFTLRLANGLVTGSGRLNNAAKSAYVADVDLQHVLSTNTGFANLDISGLQFSPRFTALDLSLSTKGVVDYVDGTVTGKGRFDWTSKGVFSTGRFRTEGMNLSATFGPVTGLKGEISFSDLLGMQTAPGQKVEIGSVNTGITAVDGLVRYQLLPNRKVSIEGGSWPFAGGTLTLKPATLDLSELAERRLTFRVDNLDAAKFINLMQFENIAATGTFSGDLPMVFDRTGGRIEGGLLTANEAGGTLSYIGEVSRENLGTYGSIAFDALKSMKYKNLAIELGGPLDGEMVTLIRFNGINQAPVTPGRAQIPLPVKVVGITGIPFIFNITIRAPFRGLAKSIRDLENPTGLISEQMEKERKKSEEEIKTK